jgi:hypothetical protein
MNPSQIKTWLKTTGKDRHWLAEKCGVHKSTVDGWLSGRPIPKPALAVLSGLIYKDEPISPRFTIEQFAKIQQKAKAEGMSVDSWIERAVLKSLLLIVVGFLGWHASRPRHAWTVNSVRGTAKAACAWIGNAF